MDSAVTGRGFDKELWRSRAWARFQRGLRSGSPAEKLEAQWCVDVVSIYNLDRLVSWCSNRGIKVLFTSKLTGGLCDFQNKIMVISSQLGPEKQFLYLLHECGHSLINSSDNGGRFDKGYALQSVPVFNRTAQHKVVCLEEEIEAWHRGKKLAKRLKLNMRQEEFDSLKTECLKTYLKWSVSRGV